MKRNLRYRNISDSYFYGNPCIAIEGCISLGYCFLYVYTIKRRKEHCLVLKTSVLYSLFQNWSNFLRHQGMLLLSCTFLMFLSECSIIHTFSLFIFVSTEFSFSTQTLIPEVLLKLRTYVTFVEKFKIWW